jgi:two-component system, OmpR family, response regulator BaeR
MRHILIVEDEVRIRELLQDYLEVEGFHTSCLEQGDEVIPFVQKNQPDAIILDILLPGMDGMEVCRRIRKFSAIPILMLTARVTETDRVSGLELGADDYICKPFSPREVIARVKAVLRRGQPTPKGETLKEGEIELHVETRQVMICGQEIQLTPIEFGLLKMLLAQPKRIFSRNELINNVQGYDFEGYDRTVDTHVKNLRKKIAAILPGQEVIHSIYGVGYKLQVTENRS